MPTQKKGCDDDEIVGLFSPQRRLFRKSKAAVLFRAKVSYRLMYILHESAMTPTHSSLGILSYNTASGRFYQPGETFMTHLTYPGLCCFLFYFTELKE